MDKGCDWLKGDTSAEWGKMHLESGSQICHKIWDINSFF